MRKTMSTTFRKAYFNVAEKLSHILEILLTIFMLTLLISVTLQVMARYIPFFPRFMWTLEVTNFSLMWSIIIGAMVATRERTHFYVDLIPKAVEEKFSTILETIYFTAIFIVSLVFIIYGIPFLKSGLNQTSQFTGLNLGYIYVSIPIAGIVWIIFLVEQLLRKKGDS